MRPEMMQAAALTLTALFMGSYLGDWVMAALFGF
jgi:hypothetical protein